MNNFIDQVLIRYRIILNLNLSNNFCFLLLFRIKLLFLLRYCNLLTVNITPMLRVLFVSALLWATSVWSQTSGTILGTVTDKNTTEPLPFVKMWWKEQNTGQQQILTGNISWRFQQERTRFEQPLRDMKPFKNLMWCSILEMRQS